MHYYIFNQKTLSRNSSLCSWNADAQIFYTLYSEHTVYYVKDLYNIIEIFHYIPTVYTYKSCNVKFMTNMVNKFQTDLELNSIFSTLKWAWSCIASFSLSLSCLSRVETSRPVEVFCSLTAASRFMQATCSLRLTEAYSPRMSERLL